MLTKEAREELEHQQYRIVGEHSTVKVCGWTRSMINGKGGCYKLKFYGIMSHQCMQSTTSISCANRCLFCWRGYKAPVSKKWKWGVDDPEFIVENLLKEHHKLLVGFKGSPIANKKIYQKSTTAKHVALSLTGEPIIYPRINKVIDLFHQKGISTFLVTNGQYPEKIKELKPITQLYLSVDAPTREQLKNIDLPLFADYWERLLQSLDYLAKRKDRTTIRITQIKNVNDNQPEKYAELIMKGNPDFIEVKSYMFLGMSRERLKEENMPLHEEVVAFAKEIVKHLPDYELMSEHIPSRVVLIAHKKFKKEDGWHTWINFEKFHELVSYKEEFSKEKFLKKTPQTGISGKGTIDQMPPEVKKRFLEKQKSTN